MPARHSLFFLVVAGPVVAAQGPLTTSLVGDPNASTSTSTTTVLTTVTVTVIGPPTTVTIPPGTTTTTVLVPSTPPQTSTSTIVSAPHPSSSLSTVRNTPGPSGTLAPRPGSGALGQNPGALAALIVGICVVIAGILALAWFTVKRHRMRDEEDQGYDQPQMASAGRSVSAGDVPPGSGRSRIIDDDPDLEIQSSAGHEVRDSSVGHAAIVSSPPGVVNPGGRSEQRADESGYFATHTTAASSNGHSSHVHITANTRNSSPTQANNPTSRNTSPTHSRRKPNRARFSLSPDRSATPSAWPPSRSEAPSRRRSVDDLPDLLHNPHRVYSDPVVFNDAPRLRSIYPRRQSSEVPRLDILPPILIHTPPPNPPSSLLRPPSATQIPTRQTLQQSRIHLDLPFVNDPVPSPAASSVSVLSGREGLLSTPPHHPTESLSSLRDSKDYSRPIGGGVVSGSGLRDSGPEPDSDSEAHPHRDRTHRRSTLA